MSGIFSPHNKMARPFGTLNRRAYSSGVLGDAASEAAAAAINDPNTPLPADPSLQINPADYPWMTYSTATQTAQQDIVGSLTDAGLCPISTDGILGPATCGAMAYLGLPMPTCNGMPSTPPVSNANGCAAPAPKPAVPSAPRPVSPSGQPSSLVTPIPGAQPGKSTSASMVMTGGLILGVAGLGYYYAKKKGMI